MKHRFRKRIRGWLLLLGCGIVVSCNSPNEPPRHLLLVTVDTARADRFSYVAGGGPGTPNVDALADRGVGFTQAISPVPLTLPAHATLMTGLQPPTHGVRDNGSFRLPEAHETLAERLSDAGFSTAAFLGAEVLDRRYGLAQGFDVYDDTMPRGADEAFLYFPERKADDVVDAALGWLAEAEEAAEYHRSARTFVWVHLFDPHTPYAPPQPERGAHSHPYDGEIAYADRAIGRLIAGWEAKLGARSSVIVVTSDHGEGLGEHDEPTHGVLVHDATIRVPLVIAAPGMGMPQSSPSPVGLVDLMPTLLDLLGLAPSKEQQGRSLVPLLQGDDLEWRPSVGYAESLYGQRHHDTAALHALRDDRYKWVEGVKGALHDLRNDPGEKIDVSSTETETADWYRETLAEVLREFDPNRGSPVAIDPESRKALESLGYAWASAEPGPAGAVATREPREALVSLATMAGADRLALRGDLDGAAKLYMEVIGKEARNVDARIRLAQLWVAAGMQQRAIPLLEQAVELAPHEPILFAKLGQALEQVGSFSRALSVYDDGLQRHRDTRDLRDGRWRSLNQLGRASEMLVEAEAAIGVDPSDGMARYARAIACCAANDDAGYLAALEREWKELPGDPVLAAALRQARANSDQRRP